MTDELQTAVKELMGLFPKSFINSENELILVPKTNLFFRLNEINTHKELYAKIIAWCSRDACKSEPFYASKRNEQYQREIRYALNEYLGVDFSKGDWELIYGRLGNGCNRELCDKFIDTDYDLTILQKAV